MIRLTGIFIYPIKGCAGSALPSAEVDALGLVGDRRFLITDDSGLFLRQRTLPRLALISPTYAKTALRLSAPGMLDMTVPLTDPSSRLKSVEVWSSRNLQAEDAGREAAVWLSEFLNHSVHLVRIGPAFHRPVKKSPTDLVTFADAYPLLVISEASLADLNGRLQEPVPMNRFRPNLVIGGAEAFAEDTWPHLRVGQITFRAGGPCARCIVTTTDQVTAERGKEPLRTLAHYRRDPQDPSGVIFGQNLIHDVKSGMLHLGDVVEPIDHP